MSTKALITFAMVFGFAVALSGCGHGDESPAPNATNATTQTAGTVKESLKITSWGPQQTKAGEPFNVQPSGNSALWIHVNQPLNGGDVTIDFNGHPLNAAVQGELVTASVPSTLYAAAGKYGLHVTVKKGASAVRSNEVKFVVE